MKNFYITYLTYYTANRQLCQEPLVRLRASCSNMFNSLHKHCIICFVIMKLTQFGYRTVRLSSARI